MRRVCIAAYHGKSKMSRTIRLVETIRMGARQTITHVAWIEEDGTVIEAWTSGGVRHVADLDTAHTPGTRVDLYSVELTGDQVAGISRWLHTQLGKGYDWKGVSGFVSHAQQDPAKWFCSELLAEGFIRGAEILILGCPSHKLLPAQFVMSPLCRLEGSVVTK